MFSKNNKKTRKSKANRKTGHRSSKDAENGVGEYPTEFSATGDLVIWKNPKVRDFFPQRFRTIMQCAFDGYIPVGSGGTTYYIRGNSLYLPAFGGSWPNALPAVATINPTGYGNLVNATFFQQWRVLGSRISVQLMPEAAVDTTIITVTPSFLANQPSSPELAMAQQFTKDREVSESQPLSSQTVVNKMTTHRLLGVRKQAVLDDLSGQFYGGVAVYPSNLWYWVINYTNANRSVTINKTPYRVRIEYECELFGDATADNLELFRKRDVPVETSSVPPSKFLDAYIAAREAEKKNSK